MKKYQSWNDYFEGQPKRGKEMLEELRDIVSETLPNVIESWGYGVPAYDLVPNAKLDKKIMIAGFKDHISIYPYSETIQHFKDELSDYKILKGTIQISHKQSIPKSLFKRMIVYRYNKVKEG